MATSSDIKRLRNELKTIWEALFEELKAANPRAKRPDLKEMTRVRFLAVIDEAARDVAAEI